jgi:hypothetical protein
MSPTEKDAARLDQLPYYREYVEQILRPRVFKLIDEVRSRLTDQVWAEIVERMAEDQKQGSGNDPQSIEKLRSLLAETLGLRIAVQLDAQFTGAAPAGQPAAGFGTTSASNGQDVVERAFPNNPLARAVGGVRRAGS